MEKEVEAIVKITKEIMTKYGNHVPMLFIIGEHGRINTAFSEFGPEHEDRVRQMANMGVYIASKRNIGELKYLMFIMEAWMTMAERGKPYIQPSKNPKRQEVLQIATLDVPSNKQGIIVYQMVRDKLGRLAELNKKPMPEGVEVESPLLPAFVAGYNLIKR